MWWVHSLVQEEISDWSWRKWGRKKKNILFVYEKHNAVEFPEIHATNTWGCVKLSHDKRAVLPSAPVIWTPRRRRQTRPRASRLSWQRSLRETGRETERLRESSSFTENRYRKYLSFFNFVLNTKHYFTRLVHMHGYLSPFVKLLWGYVSCSKRYTNRFHSTRRVHVFFMSVWIPEWFHTRLCQVAGTTYALRQSPKY